MNLDSKLNALFTGLKTSMAIGFTALQISCSSDLPKEYNVDGIDFVRQGYSYMPYNKSNIKSLPKKLAMEDFSIEIDEHGFYWAYTRNGYYKGSCERRMLPTITVNDYKFFCGPNGVYYPEIGNLPQRIRIKDQPFQHDGERYNPLKEQITF